MAPYTNLDKLTQTRDCDAYHLGLSYIFYLHTVIDIYKMGSKFCDAEQVDSGRITRQMCKRQGLSQD